MIEYAPVPEMEEYVPSIHKELRQDFPDIPIPPNFFVNSVHVDLNPIEGKQEVRQVKIPQWPMNTADRSWGIVFNENRLILQTSQYQHFDDFAQKLRRVLEVLAEKAQIAYTSNVGIRYIDNIKDIDELGINDQIGQGFLSPKLTKDFEPELSRVEHIYRSEEGHLFLRCYNLHDHPGIPEDVHIMADQLFRGQKPIAPVDGRFSLLETDHIYRPAQLEPFNCNEVINRIDRLHQGASMAFRTAVTPEALEAWGTENNAN